MTVQAIDDIIIHLWFKFRNRTAYFMTQNKTVHVNDSTFYSFVLVVGLDSWN